MKKFLMGAAAATLILSSCTKNDMLDAPNAGTDDGKVRFAGTTGLVTTKAAPGNPFNSTADLQKKGSFFVQGFVEGISKLVDAKVEYKTASWEYTDEPYWPTTWMDFYAYANWEGRMAPSVVTADGKMTASVTIADDVINTENGQKDLLVAITPNATREVRTLLTFKHALTQIVFKAGNVNPSKIDVQIGGIEIVNVAKGGDMTFEKADGKIKWAKNTVAAQAGYAVTGIDAGAKGTPKGDGDATIPTAKTFKVPDLSATPTDYSKYYRIQSDVEPANNALILVPQAFQAWDPNTGKKATDVTQTGTYIRLVALIHKADLDPASTDASKYIYTGGVKDDAGTKKFSYGEVFIPVESLWDADQNGKNAGAWVPGKRINYIITFGDNESGSGGGGYDENGDPILVPIKFRAVVEDWVEVDVPLLTAKFEAKSDAILHKFIDGYTNQLLNDIKAAAAPKVYKSEISFDGKTSANIGVTAGGLDYLTTNIIADKNVTFQELLPGQAVGITTTGFPYQNAKFRPGSTLMYDLQKVSNLDVNNAKIVVPTGWFGLACKDGAVNDPTQVKNAGETITLDGTTIDGVKLTKIAMTGYNYICQISYLEDNVASVELNENYTTATNVFNNYITVSGLLPSTPDAFFFSSDMLAKITDNGYTGSKLTVDMKAVAVDGVRTIYTTVPTGWTITFNSKIYQPGDKVEITATTGAANQVFVYEKGTGSYGKNWMNDAALTDWMKEAKTVLNQNFYYDNVDGYIISNLTTAPWSTMVGQTGQEHTIYFKHNVGSVNIPANNTATGVWAWDNDKKALTFTTNGTNQPAIGITYKTIAELEAALKAGTGISNGATLYVTMDVPANFNASMWKVIGGLTAAAEKLSVVFQGNAAAAAITAGDWTIAKDSKTAVYTQPTFTTIDLTAAVTKGQVLFANALPTVAELGAINADGLADKDIVYVVMNGATAIAKLPLGWTQTGNVLTYTHKIYPSKTILTSGLNPESKIYLAQDAPASFGVSDWVVSGLADGDKVYVQFTGAAGSSSASSGWSYDHTKKLATFTRPAGIADNAALITTIAASTAAQIYYYDAADFSNVYADPALAVNAKIYVVATGIPTGLSTGWTAVGNVVTFSRPVNNAGAASLAAGVAAAAKNLVIYTDAGDFSSVYGNPALAVGDKMYVVTSGTISNTTNGWTTDGKTATFTRPADNAGAADLAAAVTAAADGAVIYTSTTDFAGVSVGGTINTLKVIVSGSATNLPTGWAQDGNVVTYTK